MMVMGGRERKEVIKISHHPTTLHSPYPNSPKMGLMLGMPLGYRPLRISKGPSPRSIYTIIPKR